MTPSPPPGSPRKRLQRKQELERRTPLKANPDATRAFHERARKPAKRRPVSPASPAQRAKVAQGFCVVSGDREGLTPAHLCDRSLGGCDSPLCVVPLRVDLHREYDNHSFDLLPYLEAHGMRAEIAHAVEHLGLIGALERITGESWRPVELKDVAA